MSSWGWRDGRPGAFGQLLALLGLTGFAISQPLLAVLGEDPAFFVFRDADAGTIVVFALVVALVPPLGLWSASMVARWLRPALGWAVHLLWVTLLLALTILQLGKQAGLGRPMVLVVGATTIGVAGMATYARFDAVATWVRFTAVLPAIAVASFLVVSPTSALLTESAASSTPATSGEGGEQPSVVVLVLDELPTQSLLAADGTIDAVRFPNLARLAGDSTWYRNYTGGATLTEYAVPAMLTGNAPAEVAPIASEYPDNLFTWLAPSHDLEVSESVTQLCPRRLCADDATDTTATGGFSELVSGAARAWQERVAPGGDTTPQMDDFVEEIGDASETSASVGWERSPERFSTFLDELHPADEPTLWYLHLLLPHSPWRLFPDGEGYPWREFPFSQNRTEGIATLNEARHLLQAQYTDRLVGQLITRLEQEGLYGESLVVVVGDHGASFAAGRHARAWHPDAAAGLAYTPLLVKAPGQGSGGGSGGAVDDTNVSAVDLLPTLADELGLSVPWATAGVAATSAEARDRGGAKAMVDPAPPTVATFQIAGTEPSADRRLIAPARAGEGPLDGLWAALDVDEIVGRPIGDLREGASSLGGTITDRGDLEAGAAGAGVVAVTGRVPGADDDDLILVTVDDRIVSASPVFEIEGGEDDRFGALLVPGTLSEQGNRLGLALWRDGRVLSVDLTG